MGSREEGEVTSYSMHRGFKCLTVAVSHEAYWQPIPEKYERSA